MADATPEEVDDDFVKIDETDIKSSQPNEPQQQAPPETSQPAADIPLAAEQSKTEDNTSVQAIQSFFSNNPDPNPDHTKTQSLLDFFSMNNNNDNTTENNNNNDNNNENKNDTNKNGINKHPGRSLSVGQKSSITPAELSLENLKKHNQKQKEEESKNNDQKNSDFIKMALNSESAKSEQGSERKDIQGHVNEEQHENEEKESMIKDNNNNNDINNNNNGIEIKNGDDDSTDDDIIVNSGIAAPTMNNQHTTHESLQNLPTIIHDDANDPNNINIDNDYNSEPAVVDQFLGNDVDDGEIIEAEPVTDMNIRVSDDEIFDNRDDEIIHRARKSITELSQDMNNDNNNVVVDDDDSNEDKNEWMKMSQTFILKEKQYKLTIKELQEQLNAMEEQKDDAIKFWEQRAQQTEDDYSDKIDNLQQHNHRMAQDINTLKQEINDQTNAFNELQKEKTDINDEYQIIKMKFETHSLNCPLLNPNIAKMEEERRQKELNALKESGELSVSNYNKLQKENNELTTKYEKIKMKFELMETQFKDMKMENDEINKENSQLSNELNMKLGQLEQLTTNYDENKKTFDMLINEHQELEKKFEMLKQIAEEQDKILQESVFVDESQKKDSIFQKQKSIFSNDSNLNSKSFAMHFKRLTSMSEILSNNKIQKILKDVETSSDDDDDNKNNNKNYDNISLSTKSDIKSKWTDISHISRYSFINYHTHDATKEFFYLTCLVVKLNLSAKYSISPDCAESNESLWKRALSENIRFHEYYDFLYSEISNKYEYNLNIKRNSNNIIHKVVVTNPHKIKQMRDHKTTLKKLENENATKGLLTQKITEYMTPINENEYLKIKNKTTFSNNDLFGGNIKITTRKERNEKYQQRRLSQSSHGSHKSHNSHHSHHSNKDKKYRHKHRHNKHKHKHRKHKSKDNDNNNEQNIEQGPGNDDMGNHHPLNNGDSNHDKRPSQKLSME